MNKILFQQLVDKFPVAAHNFSVWASREYNLKMNLWDDAITEHRYLIAARFAGEPVIYPKYIDDNKGEELIYDFFSNHQQALDKFSNTRDPIEILSNLPFQERNEMTERIFKRQTKDSISSCLVPYINFTKPSLFDALIPYKVILTQDQKWIRNIQWCWDCQAGKIEIPF